MKPATKSDAVVNMAYRQGPAFRDISLFDGYPDPTGMKADSHVAKGLQSLSRYAMVQYLGIPGSRMDEAEDHADGRGLPRSVWAEKPHDLTSAHAEAQAVHGGEIAVALRHVA